MPRNDKDSKSGKSGKSGKTTDTSRYSIQSTVEADIERTIYIYLTLLGLPDPADPVEYNFYAVFNNVLIGEAKWTHELQLQVSNIVFIPAILLNTPVILIMRRVQGRSAKDSDILAHPDNFAGGNIDLSPLVLGLDEVRIKVRMASVETGLVTTFKVAVLATCNEVYQADDATGDERTVDELAVTDIVRPSPDSLLTLTMTSAHCLPIFKEKDTIYLAAVGLNDLLENSAINFGMSLSHRNAKKVMWATAVTGGVLGNTAFNVQQDDMFIPDDFSPSTQDDCNSVYWNSMKRFIVHTETLRTRLKKPLVIDIAAVPRLGKMEVRGRYMAFLDAEVLLQPNMITLTSCAPLKYFSTSLLSEDVQPLLEVPPTSAKSSARAPLTEPFVQDIKGHTSYIVLKLDLMEPLTPKSKISALYATLGLTKPEEPIPTVDELHIDPPPEDHVVDVSRIRKECGALAVHKELSSLACRGSVPMNQGIKRTAANRLLMRVRTMLKQFAPGDCSYLDWQDTVTAQHGAARRAVTASFAPQPPTQRISARVAASRARVAGDDRISEIYVNKNLKVAPTHPKVLVAKILRLLEERSDRDAKKHILQGLSSQTRNRFLLWLYGGQEFAKGEERTICARAAFRLSARGDRSDGIGNAIAWACLHAVHHYQDHPHAAFVSGVRMRHHFRIDPDFKTLLKRWHVASGQEEVCWDPGVIEQSPNPFIVAAAFFLCLRCYDFCERLLQCYTDGCGTRGNRRGLTTEIAVDVYYLRAASWLLRRQVNEAMEVTSQGIKRFGPTAMMSQMRMNCLMFEGFWDEECEEAFLEAERAGAKDSPRVLLQAALAVMKKHPEEALQRAMRAIRISPGAHSALVIGRVYDRLNEPELAASWAECAVKFEPLLADGWAFLAVLAMRRRDVEQARTMMRTARQVGPLSDSVQAQLEKMSRIVPIEELPETLVKDLCYCSYQ